MTAGPADTLRTEEPTHQDHRTGLRRDIEGLRAFAVLAVLVYHLGAPLTGGFSGVDVFFVISGFLITSHLLREVELTGRVRLWRFYARRAKRLLPPATLVLLLTLLGGWVLLSTTQLRTLVTDVIAATVYVVNWALAGRAVDYLAEDVEPSAVQHYWSLSVEEQFYIVVPILLILVGLIARARPRRGATVLITVLVAASFVTSVLLTSSDPAQAYFVTWTRAWELGVGSLLACGLAGLARLPRGMAQTLAVLGLAAMIASVVLVDSATPWPGYAALLPVLGTAAVIAAGVAHGDTLVGRALAIRPLVWIGGLSYSIYLWHWPLVVFGEVLWPDRPQLRVAVVLTLTLALSWLGKRFVEDPIRFGRITATSPRALLVGAAAMALVIGSAVGIRTALPTLEDGPVDADGALVGGESRIERVTVGQAPMIEWPTSDLAEEQVAPLAAGAATSSASLSIVEPASVIEPVTSGDVVPDPGVAVDDVGANYSNGCHAEQSAVDLNRECVFGDPEGDFTLVVVGDSKMGQWYEPVLSIAEEEGWRLEFYVKSACAYSADQPSSDRACDEYNAALQEFLLSEPGRVDAVLTSAGQSNGVASEPGRDSFITAWEPLLEAGIDVYVLSDNPQPPGDEYECVEENREDFGECAFPKTVSGATLSMWAAGAELPAVRFVDLSEVICPTDDDCPAVVGGVLGYRQGAHLTTTFVETLTPYLRDGLRDAGMPVS